MVAPRRWSEAQVSYMVAVMDRVLHDKPWVTKLRQQGVNVPRDTTPAQVNREIVRENRLLGGIVEIRQLAK
jgi:tripartite-type tricarboxylate transporter receptor subunit TctC